MQDAVIRLEGRDFTKRDIATINQTIAHNEGKPRIRLAALVCEALDWRGLGGKPKHMSARVAMLRMHERGLIELPPPRWSRPNSKKRIARTPAGEPRFPFERPAKEISRIDFVIVKTPKQRGLWNELIDRYHYLGLGATAGHQMRYLVFADGELVAAFGFHAAAFKTVPRDEHIGWTHGQRTKRLHLIVNNGRFLIMPWVRSRHLASKLLALVARRLPGDWFIQYGYRPVLLESFVDTTRFVGTSYRAANWLLVGATKGRGRNDRRHEGKLSCKDIWLMPLNRQYRHILCGDISDTRSR